jgi:hypothetical protein
LEFVRQALGAGKITGKRTYSENHAASFTWQLTSRQALALLDQVGPLLRTYKTKRAALVQEYYVALTPRNGKYDAKTARQRIDFETDFLAIRPVSEI